VAVTNWLIDKSAYTRLVASPDAQAWVERIERGLVRMSTVTRLQIGYSFRNGPQARSESGAPPLALMPLEYLTPAAEDRAVGVQLQLAAVGCTVPRRSRICSWLLSPRWPASPCSPSTGTST
jgi:predicted nucleic acid-binding protein